MKRVTIRVPATTANLGPGFDAFGCALSLYTDVTFEEMEEGLEITGVPVPENLANLLGMEEKHSGVFEKDAMMEYVLNL